MSSVIAHWVQTTENQDVIYTLFGADDEPIQKVEITNHNCMTLSFSDESSLNKLNLSILHNLFHASFFFKKKDYSTDYDQITLNLNRIHIKRPNELEPILESIYQTILVAQPTFALLVPQLKAIPEGIKGQFCFLVKNRLFFNDQSIEYIKFTLNKTFAHCYKDELNNRTGFTTSHQDILKIAFKTSSEAEAFLEKLRKKPNAKNFSYLTVGPTGLTRIKIRGFYNNADNKYVGDYINAAIDLLCKNKEHLRPPIMNYIRSDNLDNEMVSEAWD